MIALVGENGAGQSTPMRIADRLVAPTYGTAEIGDAPRQPSTRAPPTSDV
ncbi:ATP-binding cassette domain-containing protein [Mesorhizobium sp. B3-1-3]|nr:ATP-binding cassette domain-containing protein [Mesorhizobium sp. B3-1-3]TPI69658.1 ATP-binding cassette domain-containing protein [Mesorhizobium sp. B3-1-8]